MPSNKEDPVSTALRVYKGSGGNRDKAAEESFYSLSGIQHIIRNSQVETNPAGRPPVRPSTRTTAANMRMEGLRVEYIVKMLQGISPASLWRMFKRMKTSETSLSAVGTVLVHPYTGEILIHQEKYPNAIFHKYEGDHSIQLTWRSDKESPEAAINRLFEREVFGGLSVKKTGLDNLVKTGFQDPVINVVVADVGVSLYVFTLTEEALAMEMTSDKVTNIHFADSQKILTDPEVAFRTGAREMIEFYNYYKDNHRAHSNEFLLSDLNQRFLAERS
jgi:hypothetical protein